MQPFQYYMPTEIDFGPGATARLGEWASSFGEKALIVTGRSSARASGLLDRMLADLKDAVVFDAVTENPGTEICKAASAACRDARCDHIIAVGGGSPMDVAKVAAGLVQAKRECDIYQDTETDASNRLPLIAMPTTSGSGSEVTPYAVIVDEAQQAKRTVSGKGLFPNVAILDPELTVGLPRDITINTGLDALSQAMEGMVSKKATAFSDVLALEACRLIRTALPRVAKHPDDLDARSDMLYASMLAGCVIAQSRTTLVHGMGYPYTLECGVAHGLANALLLTPIFQFNARYAPDKVAAIVTALGKETLPNAEAASSAIAEILHELLGELGVSPAAKDAGVDENVLSTFTESIHANPYRYRNQIGDITAETIASFYAQSYEGTIK